MKQYKPSDKVRITRGDQKGQRGVITDIVTIYGNPVGVIVMLWGGGYVMTSFSGIEPDDDDDACDYVAVVPPTYRPPLQAEAMAH